MGTRPAQLCSHCGAYEIWSEGFSIRTLTGPGYPDGWVCWDCVAWPQAIGEDLIVPKTMGPGDTIRDVVVLSPNLDINIVNRLLPAVAGDEVWGTFLPCAMSAHLWANMEESNGYRRR